MANVSKGNILGILALIGAILMIVGVFVTWVSFEASALGFSKVVDYTGWNVYSDDMFSDTEYNYAPLVTLVAGVVAFFTAVLPIILKKPTVNRMLGVISLILGVVALVLMVLFYGQMDGIEIGEFASFSISAGMGLWISLVGAVLLVLGAIVDIAGKYVCE